MAIHPTQAQLISFSLIIAGIVLYWYAPRLNVNKKKGGEGIGLGSFTTNKHWRIPYPAKGIQTRVFLPFITGYPGF